MEAKELRIGNWTILNRANDFSNPIEHQVDVIDIGVYVDEPKRFSSIPLTEEWLLKFGFESGIDDFTGENKVFAKGEIRFWQHSEKTYSLYKYQAKVYIQYVHQLQNLYFCLTGTELIIQDGK